MASTEARRCADQTDETTREASAIFHSATALQRAVDGLLCSGFDREDLSVLGSDKALRDKFGANIPAAEVLADNPETPRATYVSSDSRTEGLAALAGIPVYVGGAGAAAIAALEGAAAIATAGAAVGVGALAGCVGLYAARRMERRHADQIEQHLQNGGLVLWVRTDDEERERKALDVLRSADAEDLHMHTVKLPSGVDTVPFHDAQPDPFLKF